MAEPDHGQVDPCDGHRESGFSTLYQVKGFSSSSAAAPDNIILPDGVIALRCLVGEVDALGTLFDILSRGTLEGQLYALVALRALDPGAFNNVIEPYFHNDARVEITSDDVHSTQQASEIAGAIREGGYVHTFLPELKHLVPKPEPEFHFSEEALPTLPRRN